MKIDFSDHAIIRSGLVIDPSKFGVIRRAEPATPEENGFFLIDSGGEFILIDSEGDKLLKGGI